MTLQLEIPPSIHEPAIVTATLASDRDLERLAEIDDLAGAIASLCKPAAEGQATEADARNTARQIQLLSRQIQERVDGLALALTVPVKVVEARQ
ncbi:hypothetical protein [Rhizobium mayense]|uniref:hypothetical protein n=1 Tax=Rhizobium mayense TaxID=1312184 RepID=UPI00398C3F97